MRYLEEKQDDPTVHIPTKAAESRSKSFVLLKCRNLHLFIFNKNKHLPPSQKLNRSAASSHFPTDSTGIVLSTLIYRGRLIPFRDTKQTEKNMKNVTNKTRAKFTVKVLPVSAGQNAQSTVQSS